MTCRIADFIIDFVDRYGFVKDICSEFLVNSDNPDFVIQVDDKDIDKERDPSIKFSERYLESISAHRKLCMTIPRYDAFLLHAAVINAKGRGIAFCARSGVGKTTHINFWQQLLKDDVHVVNGDKPIIRFIEEIPFAYGTPWRGKEGLGSNTRVQLSDVCFVERALENKIEKLSKEDALNKIMTQVLIPSDPQGAIKTLELIDKLISKCNVWKLQCTKDINAAEVAYKGIFKKEL